MSLRNANEALELVEIILADLELSRVPLTNAYMKACRLARLLTDEEHLAIFQYEVSGYPSNPGGVVAEVWALCLKAGRIDKKKDADTNEVSESAYLSSVEQLEASAEISKARIEFGRPQPVSISSANPNQFLQVPVRNLQLEANLAIQLNTTIGRISARRSYLYSFCLHRFMELKVSSAAETIFDEYRQKVDSLLGQFIPSELKRLDSISSNISSNNSEDWANAVHSCRRLLQAIADSLYPAVSGKTVMSGGKSIKVGPENFINRLVLYCEEKSASSVFASVVGSTLNFIGDRLDAVFSSVQKGSHATVTHEEAKRYVIYTYVIVGDLLLLTEDQLSNAVPIREESLAIVGDGEILEATKAKV